MKSVTAITMSPSDNSIRSGKEDVSAPHQLAMTSRLKNEAKQIFKDRQRMLQEGLDVKPKSKDDLSSWTINIKFLDAESPYHG